MVTCFKLHVAAVLELIDAASSPEDSVTPGWHTALSAARREEQALQLLGQLPQHRKLLLPG